MHLNNNKAGFFLNVSSLAEAFNQSRKCVESILININIYTDSSDVGYCWLMLYIQLL